MCGSLSPVFVSLRRRESKGRVSGDVEMKRLVCGSFLSAVWQNATSAPGDTGLCLCHSNAPSLQSLCIFSLANTEAGQAVINIMGIGVDTIDMVMASQSSR